MFYSRRIAVPYRGWWLDAVSGVASASLDLSHPAHAGMCGLSGGVAGE